MTVSFHVTATVPKTTMVQTLVSTSVYLCRAKNQAKETMFLKRNPEKIVKMSKQNEQESSLK